MLRGPVYAGAALVCPITCAILALLSGCARKTSVRIPSAPPIGAAPRIGDTETGIASWYGAPYHGRPTSSGEIYDQERLTAAHRTLPFGTWVDVTNLDNGKRVDVRITDRGPFVDGRIIDLSLAAAREIDMIRAGTARVRLTIIEAPEERYAVQLGAFSTRERAESFAKKFDSARVSESGSLYRVLVGRSLPLADAQRLAEKLRKASGEAMIVPDR